MTWQLGSPCGVLLFPSLSVMPFNWSSESAWAGVNWLAEVGAPVRDSAHSLFGDYAIKFSTSDSQTALARFNYDAAIWGTVNAGPYSQYLWVYPTVCVGDPIFRVHAQLEKTDDTGGITCYTDHHVNQMQLNKWNLVRNVTPPLTGGQQADFQRVDYRLSLITGGPVDGIDGGTATSAYILSGIDGGGAATIFTDGINGGSASSDFTPEAATLWADGMHFGYAADLQDMNGSYPVLFDSPMFDTLGQDRTMNIAEDGSVESVRFSQNAAAPGKRHGSFRAAYFDDDALLLIDKFWKFCSGAVNGRPRDFTLVGLQNSTARHLVQSAVLVNPIRGITRLDESMLYAFDQSWREGPA